MQYFAPPTNFAAAYTAAPPPNLLLSGGNLRFPPGIPAFAGAPFPFVASSREPTRPVRRLFVKIKKTLSSIKIQTLLRPILERLRQIFHLNVIVLIDVGDGSAYAKNAVICPCGKEQFLAGIKHELMIFFC